MDFRFGHTPQAAHHNGGSIMRNSKSCPKCKATDIVRIPGEARPFPTAPTPGPLPVVSELESRLLAAANNNVRPVAHETVDVVEDLIQDENCDLEVDILPVVKEMLRQAPRPGSDQDLGRAVVARGDQGEAGCAARCRQAAGGAIRDRAAAATSG
jgi:hypothetical protein